MHRTEPNLGTPVGVFVGSNCENRGYEPANKEQYYQVHGAGAVQLDSAQTAGGAAPAT